jgi:hypothetical protein
LSQKGATQVTYSRAHDWARGDAGQHSPSHRAGSGGWKLESASARHADRTRWREHERLDVVDLGEVVERDDVEALARCLFLNPADLSKRVWSLAQDLECVAAWRRKPENVDRMRADETELAAAVLRAREACEARR